MKICIRTFILGSNHGQLLQAYGLKLLLNNINTKYKVYHDLYHNHKIKELFSIVKKFSFFKYFSILLDWFRYLSFSLPSSKRNITIFGADTIWMYPHPVAPLDYYYLGYDIIDGHKVAFSPSNAGKSFVINKNVKRLFSNLSICGVRDIQTKNFTDKILNISCKITCDPAFFIKFDKNLSDVINQKNTCDYISTYSLNIKSVRNFLKKHNENFEELGYFSSFGRSFINQFYSLSTILLKINNSKLLITDTFHGVIMALICKTPFILLYSDIVYSRLDGQVLHFFSSERIIKLSNISGILQESWIYQRSDILSEELDQFILKSSHILKKYLSQHD